jgi:hypothetical protein
MASVDSEDESAYVAYHGPLRVLHEIKVLLKYRAVNNYQNGEYLGQRLGDKILFSLILMSLYWQTGDWKEDGPTERSVAKIYNLNALLLAMVRARLCERARPLGTGGGERNGAPRLRIDACSCPVSACFAVERNQRIGFGYGVQNAVTKECSPLPAR